MEDIKKYFDACVNYWMKDGSSREVAMVKALWWDCAEVWNADKSWNDDKIKFINQYRKYTPYDPIPEEKMVECGMA